MPSILELGVLLNLAAAPLVMMGTCLSHLHLDAPQGTKVAGRISIWIPRSS
jgi:hypothetical protein